MYQTFPFTKSACSEFRHVMDGFVVAHVQKTFRIPASKFEMSTEHILKFCDVTECLLSLQSTDYV